MSELNIYKELEDYVAYDYDTPTEMYDKNEADKVIADLEESHKREVEQLLMEIFKLKQQIEILQKDKKIIQDLYRGERDDCRIWASRAIHQKYKRCLAMARIAQDDWHLHNSFYALGHQEFEKRKCAFYEKWHKRWLELADKYKEGNV